MFNVLDRSFNPVVVSHYSASSNAMAATASGNGKESVNIRYSLIFPLLTCIRADGNGRSMRAYYKNVSLTPYQLAKTMSETISVRIKSLSNVFLS